MASRKKTRSDGKERGTRPRSVGGGVSPLRIAAGLGDPERERRLLAVLADRDDVVIVQRCLSADQLLAGLRGDRIDAVLVASDLHRLSGERLTELEQTGVALVLLVPDPMDGRWRSLQGVILPLDADAESVREGLMAAVRGEWLRPAGPGDEAEARIEPARVVEEQSDLAVFTVASGPGSPGRSTIALNLATALGAVAPTVLVDADLAGPSIAVYLDADPTRNLAMLAHAEPETSGEWQRAIAHEVQPLSARSRHSAVLCGVPKPEMQGRLSVRFFQRLIVELRQRYRYVILDIGADLLGPEVGLHRAALGLAQQILLVASTDLVGLWRTRNALALLESQLQVDLERVALILNRHDRRRHHSHTEIEWALGVSVAAMVPYDHKNAQRALAAQQPLVLGGGGASRALLEFAGRIHGGRIALPAEPEGKRRWGLIERGWPFRSSRRTGIETEEGAPDGERLIQPS